MLFTVDDTYSRTLKTVRVDVILVRVTITPFMLRRTMA